MPEKAVHLFLMEGFADWESAHAVAELRRNAGYRVETVGLTADPVVSMGGVRVLPSRSGADVDPGDVAVFILPGGDRWETTAVEPELEQMLREFDRRDVPIAAIASVRVIGDSAEIKARSTRNLVPLAWPNRIIDLSSALPGRRPIQRIAIRLDDPLEFDRALRSHGIAVPG